VFVTNALHHVALSVTDMDRAAWFYGTVLGLQEIPRPPFDFGGAWYQLGDRQLHLIVHPPTRTLRGSMEIGPRDVAGSADSPLIKRYEGSVILSYEKKRFAEMSFPLSKLEMEIAPRGACWVSVTVDGDPAFSGLMNPGDKQVVSAREEILVTVGDAGAFAFTLNGRQGKPLGAPGEVVSKRIAPANFNELVLP